MPYTSAGGARSLSPTSCHGRRRPSQCRLFVVVDDHQASVAELLDESTELAAAVAGRAEKAKDSATVEEEKHSATVVEEAGGEALGDGGGGH